MAEMCGIDPKDCPLAHRVELLEFCNRSHGETHKEIFGRLNELEKNEAVQIEQYTTIIEKLNTLTDKISAFEAKPGKRWEGIVDKAIWAVVAAIIAFILAKMGLPS